MRYLWRDIGFGLRLLLRRPGFTAAALASLILGIGLNTAVFTLLDAVFLRPLPVEDPGSLVAVYMSRQNEKGEYDVRVPHSHPNYLDLRERSRSFDGLALYQWWRLNLTGSGEPLRAAGMFVTANYFDTLGVRPARGRFFRPEDDRNPGEHPVLVLSHRAWSRFFGSDPDVVGRKVLVNGRPMTVIGVAPRGFGGTDLTVGVDCWLPVMMYPLVEAWVPWFDQRGGGLFHAFGRLRDGVSPAAAESELRAIYRNIEAAFPDQFRGLEGVGAVVQPLVERVLPAEEREQHLRHGQALGGAVGLILLITCLTVAHLLLVRGLERGREIALRRALGAGQRRLVAQLMTESLVLFLLGGALALPAARWFLDLLWRFRPPQLAIGTPELDPLVLAFALLTAAVSGLVFGLLPALGASRPDLAASLKQAGPAPSAGRWPRWLRLRRILVMGQVALTSVALIGAGLLLRSLRNAYRIDLGFDAHALVALSFAPGDQGYEETRIRELYSRVEERVAAIPGVRSARMSENRLLRGAIWRRQVFLDGQDEPAACDGRSFHRTNAVSPGFFATAGIPLLRGRDFGDTDRPDGPKVAIVNETMAELTWPGEDPIGQRFRFDYPDQPPIEVIGVVRDARYRHVREDRQFFIYLSAEQELPSSATLHVRTEGDPEALVGIVKREVRALAPDLPLADAQTMAWFVDEDLWQERASAILLTAFGALALALATIGVYGVLAQAVSGRRREIGIRMAVGARDGDLLRWVLGEGAILIGVGLAAGLVLAFLLFKLTTAVSSRLVDVSASDPVIYLLAALLLFAVALVGCLVPARRACRTDPATTLREE